ISGFEKWGSPLWMNSPSKTCDAWSARGVSAMAGTARVLLLSTAETVLERGHQPGRVIGVRLVVPGFGRLAQLGSQVRLGVALRQRRALFVVHRDRPGGGHGGGGAGAGRGMGGRFPLDHLGNRLVLSRGRTTVAGTVATRDGRRSRGGPIWR